MALSLYHGAWDPPALGTIERDMRQMSALSIRRGKVGLVQTPGDRVPNIHLDEWVVAAGVSGGVSYGATEHGIAGIAAGFFTLGIGVFIEVMKRESAKRAMRRSATS